MSFVVHRVAKSAARYTDAGGREKCGYCRFFVAPRACGKVIGPVSPAGWCKYFSRQAVSLSGGGLAASAGGASFDQNFLAGSLGTGAVFTRASTGMYSNSAGTLVSAAINTPRFDYDPQTLQLKGLLLEDASTNICLQSANLANATSWLPSGGTIAPPTATANQAVAPDGTTSAARLVCPAVNGAGNFSSMAQELTATATSYSCSVWLRGNVGGEQLYIMLATGTFYSVPVTLTTAWQRFVVTTPTVVGGGVYFQIGTDLRDGAQSAKPAQTIYAWGAQVEALPYMSSHIPTTSVSVTRAQDVLLYPAAALTGFKTTGGSWFAEFDYIKNPLTNSRVIGYGGGGVTPLFMRDTNAGSQFDGGLLDTATTTTTNVINKIASTWTAGQAKTVLNAGPVASSAALTVGYGSFATTGINVFTPQTPGGFDNLAGHIRRISYWPRVLSDSEMQAVTTLAGPTLSLDFMTPGTLDPRITFTRASTAAYIDASGFIQMAATNAPRWDYDPVTHALRGVLIEEQRTNLALQSAMGVAPWASYSAGAGADPIVTANVVAAPDGTLTGTRLVCSSVSSGGIGIWYQNITVASAVHTISMWLRGAVGGEQIYFCANNAGTTFTRTPRLTLTTQWQRFTLTTPSLAAASWTFELGTDLRDASQAATPAQTIYAWGAQVEQGAFPTSYIPTTSAAVTRAADVAVMPIAGWYNPSVGSMMLDHIIEGAAIAFGSPMSLVGASSDTDYISVYETTSTGATGTAPTLSTITVSAGGTVSTTAFYTQVPLAAGLARKAVSAWSATGQIKGAHNGTLTVSSSGAATPMPVITDLSIGGPMHFQPQINLWARRVSYWNRALSDAEMQQVTT